MRLGVEGKAGKVGCGWVREVWYGRLGRARFDQVHPRQARSGKSRHDNVWQGRQGSVRRGKEGEDGMAG